MDRPLLFLVLALVAVGVFLYLRRQDDEANTPTPGGGVPFDTDAAMRIQEADGRITDMTQRFGAFDTVSNVLPEDVVRGSGRSSRRSSAPGQTSTRWTWTKPRDARGQR